MTSSLRGPLVLCLLTSAGAGCGTGGAARAVQPGAPTGSQAVDEGKPACANPKDPDQPLIVDMEPEQRIDLEGAMRKGVAVVSYDCKSMKVLRDCHVDGSYGFFGTTLQEKVLQLRSADEVHANLPLTGAGLIAKIGADLQSGASLDLALMMVGAQRTTWSTVKPEDLKGKCDGATHFVYGAFVGAFAMKQGSGATVGSSAELFGAGAGASSQSSKLVATRVGDPDVCSKADPLAATAPSRCSVAIRLELLPVGVAGVSGDSADHPAASLGEDQCNAGYVMSEGKCTRPAAGKPHRCMPDDAADCARQCDLGDIVSCQFAGTMARDGTHGASKDAARAAAAFQKACDGGEAFSCGALGALKASGAGAPRDVDGAQGLFKKACDLGLPSACFSVAYYAANTGADPQKALTYYSRACAGGNQAGCNNAGVVYDHGGPGVDKQPARALELFHRACDGGVAVACGNYGFGLARGMGGTKDPLAGVGFMRKGCDLNESHSCVKLSRIYENGDTGVPADFHEALRLLQKSCDMTPPNAEGCGRAGAIVLDGRLVTMDKPRATTLLRKACKLGYKSSCDELKKAGLTP